MRLFNIVIVAAVLLSACSKPKEVRATLDIKKFLSLADSVLIYPTESQIKMLESYVPKQSYNASPTISDRVFWDSIATTNSGKKYFAEALSRIEKQPEVPISDETYREANRLGSRKMYKPRYYRTMDNLEYFMLAECLENKGRFIPQIETHVKAILAMKSWLHPNHDDNENTVLEGKRMSIDLGARRFASDLALASTLLDDRLSSELKAEINSELQRRIIDSYLLSCRTDDRSNHWIKGSSNWNAVCTSGTIYTTIAISQNREERIQAIGSALNSMKYYLNGFGDDGYCSEGVGYWRYGFGHYLYLAQILFEYTEGEINLFDADNPEKLNRVANFPEEFQIHKSLFPRFADSSSKISNREGNFAYIIAAKNYGAKPPTVHAIDQAAEQLVVWNQAIPEPEAINDNEVKLPNYTYYDKFGMVISRGQQEVQPFSIAFKAGHNSENHNHSDVGSYVLVLGDQIISGDIGAPSYIAGAFSPDNKARSSWGHPVPRVNNTLQSNGLSFRGEILETEFLADQDKVVMDIKKAYEVPQLQKLIRTMINDKTGKGAITLTDEFKSGELVTFGTTVMTDAAYEIVDNTTVILTREERQVKIEISSQGGEVEIKDEIVPVEKLRIGGPAYRIGIDFKEPLDSGSITIKYTPMD